MNQVTAVDTRREIKRLTMVYGGQKDQEELASTWAFVLKGVDVMELRSAVGDYLRSDARYFPKPGQLRSRILAERAERIPIEKPKEQEGAECPGCGATPVEMTAAERGADTRIFDRTTGRLRERTDDDPAPKKRLDYRHRSECSLVLG